MTKLAILKKRIIREYNKKENWEFSRAKGYPKDTYFGYASLEALMQATIRNYQREFGKKLKYWRYWC